MLYLSLSSSILFALLESSRKCTMYSTVSTGSNSAIYLANIAVPRMRINRRTVVIEVRQVKKVAILVFLVW